MKKRINRPADICLTFQSERMPASIFCHATVWGILVIRVVQSITLVLAFLVLANSALAAGKAGKKTGFTSSEGVEYADKLFSEYGVAGDYQSDKNGNSSLVEMKVFFPEMLAKMYSEIGPQLDLVKIDVTDTELDDKQLESALALAPNVKVILINSSKVTNAGIRQIARCKNLQEFYCDCPKVTDRGVESLTSLKGLRKLWLRQVTMDKSLVSLTRIKSLKSLGLDSTNLTDDGLLTVARIKCLEELDIGCTRITDCGLQHLVGMRKLKTLRLDCTFVTDGGLPHLVNLDELEELSLFRTHVSMEGIRQLAGLKKIRTLDLRQTKVLPADKMEVRELFPNTVKAE